MHQDFNVPHTPSEDASNPPQLPFPEPGQSLTPVLPLVPETPTISTTADAVQLPFPVEQPGADVHTAEQVPFPQPLPSTETIDTTHIRFLQLAPEIEAEETGAIPQVPFPQQHEETSAIPQVPQMPFPQQLPLKEGETGSPKPPQAPIAAPGTTPDAVTRPAPPQTSSLAGASQQAQMPGLVEIPFATQAMPALASATTAQEESQPLAPSNQDAKRAIINGVISFVVSIFTLVTVAGFAGLVIGIFAITYGLMGLRLAQRLPNKTGQGQAIIGIALGLLAWSIVIAAFILRVPRSS